MNLKSFNTIQRSKHFDAIAINPKLEVETVSDSETGLRYFVVRDVFTNPDAVVELLAQHNAYGGDVETLTPGYRQLISALELPSLCKLYAHLFKEFTEVDTKLSSWYYTTGIYHPEMMAANKNNMPKFEPYPIATSLCLTKEPKGGLNFYKLKLDNEEYFRYNERIKDCDQDTFRRLFPLYSGKSEEEPVRWESFSGNDDWENNAHEPFVYNSVIIYDPLYFHQFTFAEEYETEYLLNGFLDAPIVDVPFWHDKEEQLDSKPAPTPTTTFSPGSI